MDVDRARLGLLVSSLGGILLAASVFLPWYRASLAHGGAPTHVTASTAPPAAFLTGQAALSHISIVLLALAGLALVDALPPLASSVRPPDGAGGSLVLVGLAAGACVTYRIAAPPSATSAAGVLALSPRAGAWLALLGALAIVLGGLLRGAEPSPSRADPLWPGLSGWTPQR
jgi:hypothetical protein